MSRNPQPESRAATGHSEPAGASASFAGTRLPPQSRSRPRNSGHGQPVPAIAPPRSVGPGHGRGHECECECEFMHSGAPSGRATQSPANFPLSSNPLDPTTNQGWARRSATSPTRASPARHSYAKLQADWTLQPKANALGEPSAESAVEGGVSTFRKQHTVSPESIAPTSPNWPRRVARAPGRLLLLGVLSLMELLGRPKVKQFPSSRQAGEGSLERVR